MGIEISEWSSLSRVSIMSFRVERPNFSEWRKKPRGWDRGFDSND